MQTLILQFLHDINIAQLLVMGLMLWFFYSRLNDKIEKSEKKLEKRIDDLDAKLNKLSDKVDSIDLRLHKLEWIVEAKFHGLPPPREHIE